MQDMFLNFEGAKHKMTAGLSFLNTVPFSQNEWGVLYMPEDQHESPLLFGHYRQYREQGLDRCEADFFLSPYGHRFMPVFSQAVSPVQYEKLCGQFLVLKDGLFQLLTNHDDRICLCFRNGIPRIIRDGVEMSLSSIHLVEPDEDKGMISTLHAILGRKIDFDDSRYCRVH